MQVGPEIDFNTPKVALDMLTCNYCVETVEGWVRVGNSDFYERICRIAPLAAKQPEEGDEVICQICFNILETIEVAVKELIARRKAGFKVEVAELEEEDERVEEEEDKPSFKLDSLLI